MQISVTSAPLEKIKSLREVFLHEANMQFVCNKCHDYGWADTYLFEANGVKVGYGSVWGTDRRQDRDTIFEFYITKPYRRCARGIFDDFVRISKADKVEAQSNDIMLATMLHTHCDQVMAEAILFEDDFQTDFQIKGAVFRARMASDPLDGDDSEFVIAWRGQIVATGGIMLNYNVPYGDIYMAVGEKFRSRGFGTLMVQELKRTAFRIGRIPAARCNIHNTISMATLQKAGFKVCGFRLKGNLRPM